MSDKHYYCDFAFFHHMKLLLYLSNNIFNDYPLIQKFMTAFEELDGIKNFLDNRPKIIDIGTDPKLEFKGKSLSTNFGRN